MSRTKKRRFKYMDLSERAAESPWRTFARAKCVVAKEEAGLFQLASGKQVVIPWEYLASHSIDRCGQRGSLVVDAQFCRRKGLL